MKWENVILVRVDDYVYKRVEEIVEESRDLGMTKSERRNQSNVIFTQKLVQRLSVNYYS